MSHDVKLVGCVFSAVAGAVAVTVITWSKEMGVVGVMAVVLIAAFIAFTLFLLEEPE